MKIILASTGKGSVLSGQFPADLYIDCRGMVNPFRDPTLEGLTGDDKLLQDWIKAKNQPYIQAAINMIETALATAPSRSSFKAKEKPLTVAFFCLAGVHRSRGLKNVVGEALKSKGLDVEVL